MDIVTDAQIRAFIDEVKLLQPNFTPRLKDGIGKYSFEHQVIGLLGNMFKIIIRQSKINPLDFSVIFGVLLGGNLFRIKRYNGNSHTHMNKLEKIEIQGFHIHLATQKYQENGFKEEGYAEKTTRYSDWKTALDLMLNENNFEFEVDKEQRRLV
ncbi:hypothetical protein L6303_07815 [archaeon]|nr:hypothetical protein [Nanoarchaeota archaeon]MBU4452111.1 hypothetical protein [Nanoarchaeota archaeon]MCG2724621.1 hypothetical protein [archaeon]